MCEYEKLRSDTGSGRDLLDLLFVSETGEELEILFGTRMMHDRMHGGDRASRN